MRKGAFDCFTKPVDHNDLLRSIEKQQDDPRQYRHDDWTECSHAEIKKQVLRVAPRYNNFNRGESGTGKELVAKSIHQMSSRSEKT